MNKRNTASLFAQKLLANPDGINIAEQMIQGAIDSALGKKDAHALKELFKLQENVEALKERS